MEEELQKVSKYIQKLETENKKYKQNIELLLNEPEIQSLPSFRLFNETYGRLIGTSRSVVKNVVTTTAVAGGSTNEFDSIYCPPACRGKKKLTNLSDTNKPSITLKQKLPIMEKDHISTKTTSVNDLPTLDDELAYALFDKPAAPSSAPALVSDDKLFIDNMVDTSKDDEPIDKFVTTRPVGNIILVEFSGIRYIINNSKIYQLSDGKKIGEITDNIVINGSIIKIDTRKINPIQDDIYESDNYAYMKINQSIAYRIGEIKEAEIHAWI